MKKKKTKSTKQKKTIKKAKKALPRKKIKKVLPKKKVKKAAGKKVSRASSAKRKKELDKIIKELKKEQLSLQERIEKSKRDEWIGNVKDEIDTAVASAERDILFDRVDRFVHRLDEVENALKKSKRKFGLCETCGSEISLRRLKLIPYARYCYKCISKL